MDSGEVIPGLNDRWTLMGANLMEWMSGFLMTMLIGSAFQLHPSRSTPIIVGLFLGTTFGLAALRRQFPDEHKGVASLFLVKLGLAPPHIPRPASLQPFWSGAPVKEINERKDYMYLDLDDMFDLMKKEKEERS